MHVQSLTVKQLFSLLNMQIIVIVIIIIIIIIIIVNFIQMSCNFSMVLLIGDTITQITKL